VGVDPTPSVVAATKRLRAETNVPGLLAATAVTFVEVLDVPACTISRVIGDLLVDLVQHQRAGKPDRLGHGYLISDYPLTRAVIETRNPHTVHVRDPDADPAEASLLRELGFDSLLMVAIESGEVAWGLVEVYDDRQFDDSEVEVARTLAAEAGNAIGRLGRPAL
jgi:GAF domain-containing protein